MTSPIYESYLKYLDDESIANQNEFINLVNIEDDKTFNLIKSDGEMKLCFFVRVDGDDDYSGIEIYAKDFLEKNENSYPVMECTICCFDVDTEEVDNEAFNLFYHYLIDNGFKYEKEFDEVF